MKSPYLSQIEPNRPATGTFLVHAKEVRRKKSGEPYLSLTLGDRTGEIDAKMWDNVAEVAETFDRDDYVCVKGLIQTYNNRRQFTIHTMHRVDPDSVDPVDFFPASERDPEEMFGELRRLLDEIRNPDLRALLDLFLEDQEIAARFKKAPAAKQIHHAYLGGLLEHVLSLVKLCRLIAPHYPWLDLDLLVTGAVLHDMGKIYELSYERSFGYTTEGELLGHIAMTLRMLHDKFAQLPAFPARTRTLLEHMVLTHHGQLEFGSPKVPLFAEALMLHYLDDLDSKMEHMRTLTANDRQIEGHWTGYSSSLDRMVLKKEKYLAEMQEEERDGPPMRPAVPAPAPAKAPPAASAPAAGTSRRDATAPAPGPPRPASRQASGKANLSLFGEKLAEALHQED